MRKVIRKTKKFIKMDFKLKCLMVEAFIFLARGRFLKLLPFAKVAPSLGEELSETPVQIVGNEKIIKDVSLAVETMSRYTFWESACLVQAIAATRMLNRRKIPTTLYLGIARDPNGKMLAHAWVRSGSYYVTGSSGKHRFTVVNTFAGGWRKRGVKNEEVREDKSR